MTDRNLSEKLCAIACSLNELSEGDQHQSVYRRELVRLADELHTLSNEKFTPGTTSWSELSKQAGKPGWKPQEGLPF